MAFMIHSIDGSDRIPGIEYLPCAAISGGAKVGMPLYWSSGKLAACTATTAPVFISMIDQKGATPTAGTLIPVVRIDKDMIFEAPMSWGSSSISGSAIPGAAVTINTTTWGVTDTTSSGVATLVKPSDVSGGPALFRF